MPRIIINFKIQGYEKNDAAKKLLAIYNSCECRKIKLATMLKKMYRDGDLWRVYGFAHDYTI